MKHTSISVTEDIDLSGKVALVTGASSGLGQECARVLALRGAHVLMACRNEAKARGVINVFEEKIGAEAAARCEVQVCDLASMSAVHALCERIRDSQRSIDLLHLNAGVFGIPYTITDDQLEFTYAANYIGHFLLVHRLASDRVLGSGGRIVATLSEGAYLNPWARLDLDMLAAPTEPKNAKRHKKSMGSPNSKVLLMLMMKEFSRRVRGTALSSVTFNSGNPGGTLTDNVNQVGPALRVVSKVFAPLLFKDVTRGAAILLWLATAPELREKTGILYNHKRKEARIPKRFREASLATEAWEVTERLLNLQPFEPS